jgi:hypothetical protein
MSTAIGQAMQVHLFLGYMGSKRIRLQNIERQYLKLNWSRQNPQGGTCTSRWIVSIESNQEKKKSVLRSVGNSGQKVGYEEGVGS